MRLNMDCIRDILLCIEDLVTPTKFAQFYDVDLFNATANFFDDEIPKIPLYQEKLLKKYTNEELIYHLQYCISANLIKLHDESSPTNILIKDLTPKGHSFIENIRQDTIYNKVLSIAKEKAGAVTLETIIDISSKVISGNITSFFGF